MTLFFLMNAPAYAEKPSWAGVGKPDSDAVDEHREAMKNKHKDKVTKSKENKKDKFKDKDKWRNGEARDGDRHDDSDHDDSRRDSKRHNDEDSDERRDGSDHAGRDQDNHSYGERNDDDVNESDSDKDGKMLHERAIKNTDVVRETALPPVLNGEQAINDGVKQMKESAEKKRRSWKFWE